MPTMVEAVSGNAGRADYPRMLYHQDGRFIVVQNPEQHDAQLKQGFSQNPQAVHQVAPIVKQPIVSDSITILIREALERVLDERGLTKQLGMSLQAAAGVAPNAQVAYTTGAESLPPVPLTQRRSSDGK